MVVLSPVGQGDPPTGEARAVTEHSSWCTLPLESSTDTERVSLSPSISGLIKGVDFTKLNDLETGDLALKILKASGPLTTSIATEMEASIRYHTVEDFALGKKTLWGFVTSILHGYHMSIQEKQGLDTGCLPTGQRAGFRMSSVDNPVPTEGFIRSLGPKRSLTYDDVVARGRAIVGSTSECALTVQSAADRFLLGGADSGEGYVPNLGDGRLWSQLSKINATVLQYELALSWETALGPSYEGQYYSNTSWTLVEMHQLARYLFLTKEIPGAWATYRGLGVDRFVLWIYNLLASVARPIGNLRSGDFRDCWTLAFGEDSETIREFVSNVGTLDDPKIAIADALGSWHADSTSSKSPGSKSLRLKRGTSLSKTRIAAHIGISPSRIRTMTVDRRDKSRCSATSNRVKGLKMGTCRLVVSIQSGKSRTTNKLTLSVV